MKLIRNTLLILFFLLSLAIVSLSLASYYIKPEAFKAFAEKQLSSMTLHESKIEGDVRWRLLPRPGLHVSDVTIGDTTQEKTDYAFKVQDLTFHLQFLPLFQGKIVFNKLILDEFKLLVNFDNLNTAKPEVKKEEKPVPSKKRIFKPSIALKQLTLSNGQVNIVRAKEVFTINDVRIETNMPNQAGEQPFHLKGEIKHESETHPFSGLVSYKGMLVLPPLNATNTPAHIKLNGQLLLESILAGHYQIDEIRSTLNFKDEVLTLNPLTIALYGGESVGDLSYNLKTQVLQGQQTATNIEAEPLIEQFFSIKPAKATGQMDVSIHGKAGLKQADWQKRLQGGGNITLKNGEIRYLDIPKLTQEATKTIKALASQNIESLQQVLSQMKPWQINHFEGSTPFKMFNVQFEMNKDAFVSYQMLLESEKLNLKGRGTLQLETQAVHANLKAQVISNDKTTAAVQALLGGGFPILVTGTLDAPIITPDRPGIQKLMHSGDVPVEMIKSFKHLQQKIIKIPKP